MMKTSDVLRAAWALIDAPEKWSIYPHIIRTDDDRRCSTDALIDGARAVGHYYFVTEAGHYLAAACEVKADPGEYGELASIGRWNDSHSWPEVRDMWQRAIQLAERDEALAEQQADGTLGELREIAAEQEFGCALNRGGAAVARQAHNGMREIAKGGRG